MNRLRRLFALAAVLTLGATPRGAATKASALETAHAVVEGMRQASSLAKDDVVVICFSGRGDKDCFEVARLRGEEI